MWRDDAYLLDMLLNARHALSFVRGLDLPAFLSDRKTQLAVERCLEIVGEAANKVSREYTVAHPEIPWPQIVGLRNRLAHDYNRTDYQMVWKIVTQELPALVSSLEPLVPPEKPD